MFEMEWRGRWVALKASNGRYVCMKKNGQLAAISDFVGEHTPPALGSPGLGAVPGDSASSASVSTQGWALSLPMELLLSTTRVVLPSPARCS